MEELDERAICDRIRDFRLMRNMTLDNLASLTGLTKGYLSRIENSGKAPPISTLAKIAAALKVDMISFLRNDDEEDFDANLDIIRKNERKVSGSKGVPYGYTFESLAYRMPGKNMEPYLITITDAVPTTEYQHEGEEFIHILDGKIAFSYEEKVHILEEGDSAYFNAGISHSGRSVGGPTARFLCVIYDYRRS
jgi:transcriptional regulator with XRE-family HTH domain